MHCPKDSELTFFSKSGASKALISCSRMIRERLGSSPNKIFWLELALGPIGFIPADLYRECGITVKVPPEIRFITLLESSRFDEDGEPKPVLSKNDAALTDFILKMWNQRNNLPA